MNLSAQFKMSPPGYQTLLNRHIPVVKLTDESGTVRVIAGDFQGAKGPARTFPTINLWDIRLKARRSTNLILPRGYTTVLVVLRGIFDYQSGRMGRIEH